MGVNFDNLIGLVHDSDGPEEIRSIAGALERKRNPENSDCGRWKTRLQTNGFSVLWVLYWQKHTGNGTGNR